MPLLLQRPLLTQGLYAGPTAPPAIDWQPGGAYGADPPELAGGEVVLVCTGAGPIAAQVVAVDADAPDVAGAIPWETITWWGLLP
jgi:hypothetical protein